MASQPSSGYTSSQRFSRSATNFVMLASLSMDGVAATATATPLSLRIACLPARLSDGLTVVGLLCSHNGSFSTFFLHTRWPGFRKVITKTKGSKCRGSESKRMRHISGSKRERKYSRSRVVFQNISGGGHASYQVR